MVSKPKKDSTKPSKKLAGLRIDIETRSGTDISAGSYRYAEDPDFRVLVIAYAPIWLYPGGATRLGKPRCLDLDNDREIQTFKATLTNPDYIKTAFNANFERIALSKWLGMPNGTYIDPENWHCSAVLANTNGVFGSLDEVARAVRSPIHKDPEGRRLIKLFSEPDKKTGQFHDPCVEVTPCWCGVDHLDDFEKFEAYCENDVLTEAVATNTFAPLSDNLQREYEMDQRINDIGVRHHKKLSEQAVLAVSAERDRIMTDLKRLTKLDNPNSIQQMKGWLASMDYPMSSLDKAHRAEALADPTIPKKVAKVLTLKGEASLSSVAKHNAALKSRCEDGRIRGSLRFYGAHTGREAGNGIQPQNLPRYEAPRKHRKALLKGTIGFMTGVSVAEAAKGTVRSSLIPTKGHVFVVADYNAIEARVLAGEAGEKWVEDECRGEGKIYEATAAQMFGVPKRDIVLGRQACFDPAKDDFCGKCRWCSLRGRGKVSNLALGYGGGAGALVTMGAEKEGIDIGNYADLNREWVQAGAPGKFHEWNRDLHNYPELIRLRDLYRDTSPATVKLWRDFEKAWDVAALQGKKAVFGQNNCLTMTRDGKHNRLILPSGRSIWYRYARSHPSAKDPDRIEARTFVGKSPGVGHSRGETFGGRLCENGTQAIARDVLFDLLMRIQAERAKGWPARPVLHVHDEVVLEVKAKHAEQILADTVGMMSEPPKWGKFLIVRGEGKILERYGK